MSQQEGGCRKEALERNTGRGQWKEHWKEKYNDKKCGTKTRGVEIG